MAGGFAFDSGFFPVGQGLAQAFLGLGAAMLAVKGFEPVLHRVAGLVVKRAQEHRFPVVPRIRADAANVADR